MSELLTFFDPIAVAAPWGTVEVRWPEPSRVFVVLFHTLASPDPEWEAAGGELRWGESHFAAVVAPTGSRRVTVTVTHTTDRVHFAHPRASPRPVLNAAEIAQWKVRLAAWLSTWVVGRTSEAVLARALAHHNEYVRLVTQYPTIFSSERPQFEKRMVRCLARALPATPYLLMSPRRAVREFALLHYTSLVGLGKSLTSNDLNLDRSANDA